MRFPLARRMDDFLVQAGVSYPLGVFVLLSAVLALVGFLLLSMVSRSQLLSVLGLALGLAPLPVVRMMKTRRMRRFEAQLPDALDMIARSLRAGHALTSGIEMAGQEFPDPLGPEFAKTVAQITFGVGMEQALRNLTKRVDCPDLKFLAVSIIIQRESRGQSRGDTRNHREAHPRAAQAPREDPGPLGGGEALGNHPARLALPRRGGAARAQPDLSRLLLSDPLGRVLVVAAVMMMLLGMGVIKKTIDIKV